MKKKKEILFTLSFGDSVLCISETGSEWNSDKSGIPLKLTYPQILEYLKSLEGRESEFDLWGEMIIRRVE